ncbi:MAG: cysteine--tRNA ligase [Nanoarchaeota archaeon]|nr:cysteine--tRNA ligase [Nanoarchaeota archaeon]
MFKIYNTLTRKTSAFKPIEKGNVKMYSCGPTVYDFAHIGNFRAYIVADLLKRALLLNGLKVKHVMNLTDVDDKTIKGSRDKKLSLKKFTSGYSKSFFEDMDALRILKADVYPKATEHIDEMVAIVKDLEKNGIAYQSDDGSWYYSIAEKKDYGKLGHISFDDLEATERVKKDSYAKEQAQDFALWKAYDAEDGDVSWSTSLGKGRPGWHIECSAMSMKHLGKHFDIHTGGIDLVFPHHENEIAQSEGVTGDPFVNYWVHNEHLLVDGRKMSKSMGNFYTLRDLFEKGYDARSIRYLLLSVHYRQQLNFTLEGLQAAQAAVERINNFLFVMKNVAGEDDEKKVDGLITKADKDFMKHLDDDLSIAEALGVVFVFMTEVNKLDLSKSNASDVIEQMMKFDEILGVMEIKEENVTKAIEKLIKEREDARTNKDWATADKIRDELGEKGIELIDTADGVRWKKHEA